MARILLVEDNELSRDVLARRLVRRGYTTLVAVDGAQAIESAKANAPDIILMDINLPVLNGLEVTRRLKSLPETRPIPVLVLTAHVLRYDRAKCLAAGADDYDTKPVDLPRLLEKIEALLSRGHRAPQS